MFDSLNAWLTPPRRKALYRVGMAVAAALVAFGVIPSEQVEQFKDAVLTIGGMVAVLTNVLAVKNVPDETPDEDE